MEEKSTNVHLDKKLKAVGWILSIIGTAFYCYGYFADGGAALINWPQYLPEWASQFVPNWQAEAGLSLSIIGAIPIYYVDYNNL